MANAKKDLFEKWIENGEVENKLAVLQSLSMQGKSLEEMAKCFDISKRTLINLKAKHAAIDKAISQGRLTVVAMCQNKLMERVSSGDTTAIIYALKVYGGEFFNDRKTVKAEITGTPVAQPLVQFYLPATDTEVDEGNGEKT